jgi:hypothetical protein
MIKLNELIELGFYVNIHNNNEYFLYGWEYLYVVSSCDFFCIYDGCGEEEFIAKIYNLEHLKEIIELLPENN